MDDAQQSYVAGWARDASELVWRTPFSEAWREGPRGGSWFTGGELSVYDNCVAQHLAARPAAVAVQWEGEPGDHLTLTYQELADRVDRLAFGLRGLGVERGGRVALHLGWIPETVTAILACARIGATYTILPVSLPVEAMTARLEEFAPTLLFTQDGAWRRGTILPLKARADDALSAFDGVAHTVVVRRTGIDVPWFEGDHWYADLVESPPDTAPSAALDGQSGLLEVSLAARGGRPLSLTHPAATTMAVARRVHREGVSSGTVLWALGDSSWLASQVHGIFGPLLWGETAVMYEGTIDVPDSDRLWRIVEQFGVTTLLMAPSVGHALKDVERGVPAKAAIRTLRRIVTIGDDPGEDLSSWLRHDVGRGRVEVADGWGQMELCGVVTVDHAPTGRHMPDVGTVLLDATAHAMGDSSVGELGLSRSWPGMGARLRGDRADQLADAHWPDLGSVYATGDLARRRPDGTLAFAGRIDEVASVSGQLVSLEEIRETLLDHPFVSEAEVVTYRDPRHGASVATAVVEDSSAPPLEADQLHDQLSALVEEVLGGIARPRVVLVLDHVGDEITRLERRRALELLASASPVSAHRLRWDQVVAAVEGV